MASLAGRLGDLPRLLSLGHGALELSQTDGDHGMAIGGCRVDDAQILLGGREEEALGLPQGDHLSPHDVPGPEGGQDRHRND